MKDTEFNSTPEFNPAISIQFTFTREQRAFLMDRSYGLDRMRMYMHLCDCAALVEYPSRSAGEKLIIKVGQAERSIKQLALEWNCDFKTAMKVVREMQRLGMVTTHSDHRISVHSIHCIHSWFIGPFRILNAQYKPRYEKSRGNEAIADSGLWKDFGEISRVAALEEAERANGEKEIREKKRKKAEAAGEVNRRAIIPLCHPALCTSRQVDADRAREKSGAWNTSLLPSIHGIEYAREKSAAWHSPSITRTPAESVPAVKENTPTKEPPASGKSVPESPPKTPAPVPATGQQTEVRTEVRKEPGKEIHATAEPEKKAVAVPPVPQQTPAEAPKPAPAGVGESKPAETPKRQVEGPPAKNPASGNKPGGFGHDNRSGNWKGNGGGIPTKGPNPHGRDDRGPGPNQNLQNWKGGGYKHGKH